MQYSRSISVGRYNKVFAEHFDAVLARTTGQLEAVFYESEMLSKLTMPVSGEGGQMELSGMLVDFVLDGRRQRVLEDVEVSERKPGFPVGVQRHKI